MLLHFQSPSKREVRWQDTPFTISYSTYNYIALWHKKKNHRWEGDDNFLHNDIGEIQWASKTAWKIKENTMRKSEVYYIASKRCKCTCRECIVCFWDFAAWKCIHKFLDGWIVMVPLHAATIIDKFWKIDMIYMNSNRYKI